MTAMSDGENKRRFGTLVLSIIVAFVILLCLVIGMVFLLKVYGSSAGGTLRSGRSVMVHSNALSLSTSFGNDAATIDTAGKTIVVHPTELLIDGTVVAKIDAATKDVAIHVTGGDVSFVADGTTIQMTRQ